MQKAAAIRLAVFDVDGVLTGGEIIYQGNGVEQKVFHVQDGLGLKLLMRGGCEVGIITSRTSAIVTARMQELGITRVHQGVDDKRRCLQDMMQAVGVRPEQTAYTGDDLIDLPAMRQCGLAIAVANAHPFVRSQADWVSTRAGGAGAVREICDLILDAQGRLEGLQHEYLR